MAKFTGTAAIQYAEHHGLTLNKYADPTEGARSGLTVQEAREIAREDGSLIWLNPDDYAYGYTFPEWLAAAGRQDSASEHDLPAAWRAGEDPANYAP